MKIVTDDKASELAVMLLQNDKKIKEELIQNNDDTKKEFEESIDAKITEVNNDVNDKFQKVNDKIEQINIGTMPTITIDEINELFK